MPIRAITQARLSRDSGLAQDVSINVMHWEGGDVAGEDNRTIWDGQIDGLLARISQFYISQGARFASTLSGDARIDAYDWSDPKPRIPRASLVFQFVPSTAAYPAEVSVVLSYEAQQIPGVNQATRRGRIWLGPLNPNNVITAGDARPRDVDISSMLQAAVDMAAVPTGSAAFRLAVFSPTRLARGSSEDEAWNDVVAFSVDDAFDTMRSRGAGPTKRVRQLLA